MNQENSGKISNLVNIPLKDIYLAKFDTSEFDTGKSVLTILALGVGVALVWVIFIFIYVGLFYEK